MEGYAKNNMVVISGLMTVEKRIRGFAGQQCFFGVIESARLSGYVDRIQVAIPVDAADRKTIADPGKVVITGHFVSESINKHLALKVLVCGIDKMHDHQETGSNQVSLCGWLKKAPVVRVTPLGREIADLLLAIVTPEGKYHYIPCVVWGRNAVKAEGLKAGDNIRVTGRIQSRDYQKRISEGETVTRTAYEVSVARVTYVR